MSQKPKPIQISIPHPCIQSWDEMTPDGQGRHCAHCAKTVIDFTSWSDAALYRYFVNDTGNTCGRFLSTQLDRKLSIPHQPHSRLYRMTIALGLTLLFTQTPELLAQTRPPIAAQTPDTNKYRDEEPRMQTGGGYDILSETRGIYQQQRGAALAHGSIEGRVADERKEPVINAVVQVYQNSVLKGGNVTDLDGNFVIKPLDPGEYEMRIHSPGYDSLTMYGYASSGFPRELTLRAAASRCRLGGPIGRNYSKPLQDKDNPTKRTFTRDELNRMPH